MTLHFYTCICLLILTPLTHAASFDCSVAKQDLDKTICKDKQLSQLDVELANVYFQLKEKIEKEALFSLLDGQREWLKQRVNDCELNDSQCLVALY